MTASRPVPPPELANLRHLDPHNRMFQLLSYNPVLIDPRMYMQSFEQTSDYDVSTKDLLLRRLLFHQRYGDCWQVFFELYTDLTDVDMFIEMAFEYLKSCNNHGYGWFYFVLAAHGNFPERFLEVVMETALRYSDDAIALKQAVSMYPHLCQVSLLRDLLQWKDGGGLDGAHPYVLLMYMKMYLLLAPPGFPFVRLVSEYPEVCTLSGWISHIANVNANVEELVLEGTKINTNDALTIMESIDLFKLWKAYSKIHGANSLIVSQLVHLMASNNPRAVENLLLRKKINVDSLNYDETVLLLSLVSRLAVANQLIDKLATNDRRDTAFQKMLASSPLVVKQSIMTKIFALSTDIEALLDVIDTRTDAPLVYRKLDVLNMDHNTVLCILDRGVRIHGVLDSEFVIPIVDHFLRLSFNPDEIYLNPHRLTVNDTQEIDFQRHWRYALPLDRVKFKHNLRELSGVLSKLSNQPQVVCRLLEVLFEYIYSSRFLWLAAELFGKRYIFQLIVNFMGVHIERQPRGLYLLRDILAQWHLPSRVLQGAIFRVMAKEDPHTVLQLLEINLPRYHLQEIMLGLITLNITMKERLQYVQQVVKTTQKTDPFFKIETRAMFRLVLELKRMRKAGIQVMEFENDLAWIQSLDAAAKALRKTILLVTRRPDGDQDCK